MENLYPGIILPIILNSNFIILNIIITTITITSNIIINNNIISIRIINNNNSNSSNSILIRISNNKLNNLHSGKNHWMSRMATLSHLPLLLLEPLLTGSITLLDFVGQGSFAHVYLAYDAVHQSNCAVKCLPKRGLDAVKRNAQRREAQALEALNGHPNIVRLLRVIDTDDEWLLLVMEFCEMDLFEAIMQQGGFPDAVVRDVFGQLCDGLAQCHSRGYFHRDLKPENCLVDPSTMTVKLTDFGLVTRDTWSREMGCGSARYLSPEACTSADGARGYSPAATDIWALGLFLSTFYLGRILRQFDLSPELDRVLRRVFCLDPAMRLPLHELRRQVLAVPQFITPAATSSSIPANPAPTNPPAPVLPLLAPARPGLVALDHPMFLPRPPAVSPASLLSVVKEPSSLDIIVDTPPTQQAQPQANLKIPTHQASPWKDGRLELKWAQPSRLTPLVPNNLSLGREGIGRLGISRLTQSRKPRSSRRRHVVEQAPPTADHEKSALTLAAAALHPLANAIAGWSLWAPKNSPELPITAPPPVLSPNDEEISDDDDDNFDDAETASESSSTGENRVPDEEDPYESVQKDRRRVRDLETGTHKLRVQLPLPPPPSQLHPPLSSKTPDTASGSLADFERLVQASYRQVAPPLASDGGGGGGIGNVASPERRDMRGRHRFRRNPYVAQTQHQQSTPTVVDTGAVSKTHETTPSPPPPQPPLPSPPSNVVTTAWEHNPFREPQHSSLPRRRMSIGPDVSFLPRTRRHSADHDYDMVDDHEFGVSSTSSSLSIVEDKGEEVDDDDVDEFHMPPEMMEDEILVVDTQGGKGSGARRLVRGAFEALRGFMGSTPRQGELP
ncbi:kinase-like domain-containing protein [Chytridium lagenaria]|nr:kinase-like domain-containing protein [Chytridium lagenaria]